MKLQMLIICTFFTASIAQCPCDSFVNDFKKLQLISENVNLSNEILRIRNCINCREKLGLTYSFCDANIQENIGLIKNIEQNSATIANRHFRERKSLYYKISNYKDNCQENKCIDMDSHLNNGVPLIRSGVVMLIGSAILVGLSPKALAWCFSFDIFEDDGFEYFAKIIGTLIIPVTDVGLCAGGIVMLKIGINQKRDFK
jgi:hypothetical protein